MALSLLCTAGAAAEHMSVGKPVPFRIDVPEPVLTDLRDRLLDTRFPAQLPGAGWQRGMDTAALKALVAYWARGYDWRAAERRLNAWPQFRVDIGGQALHYQYIRGRTRRAVPLLLLHGWPSSFVQFQSIIPLLTDPAAHGGAADALSFDVVVASLPGFGFSEAPAEGGAAVRAMAERMHLLMTEVLGYPRYAVRGSDIGGVVLQQLALLYPRAVLAAHTSGTLRGVAPPARAEQTPEEARYFADAEAWNAGELAYANLHASKPQTLVVGLNDSPAGLAAWILEKFHGWGDTSRSLEERYGRDALLTNLMVYWVGAGITPSVNFYYDFRRESGRAQGRVEVPTAMLMGLRDMVPPPRALCERQFRVTRWHELPRGGHFLEWEDPEATARDLREFIGTLVRH
jgi:pimeloyl-ACP methyl ester carboxylesterase